MAGQQIGYIRVSSVDQNTARQLEGIQLDEIFTDKCSGKDTKRPELEACLKYLRKGDSLHVHSIDRLARNLQDLLNILDSLTSKGISVVFHKEGLTFTGKEDPFQKLQLQIIGAVAQFERSLIRERQREGIAIAKKQGKYKGRKPVITPELINQARAMAATGQKKQVIADKLGICRATLYKALKTIQQ